MKTFIEKIVSIAFGVISPGSGENLCQSINEQVTELCESLPNCVLSESVLFFMKYAGIKLGEPLDFFSYFHRPVWSPLYWLTNREGPCTLSRDSLDHAIRGHAMAMTLHSLDDHLVDGTIPVSHLTLLIRSEAWRRLNDAIDRFCADLPGGIEMARGLIDDYYGGITEGETPKNIEGYCDLFRKQLATGLVMPLLLARKTGCDDRFMSGLRSATESFGIAWRLLDDIQDLEEDMAGGTRSAVYVCLDDKGRALWDKRGQSKGKGTEKRSERICAMVNEGKIIESIASRIVAELDNAATLADGIGLGGLAEEYRVLAGPVREWVDKNR